MLSAKKFCHNKHPPRINMAYEIKSLTSTAIKWAFGSYCSKCRNLEKSLSVGISMEIYFTKLFNKAQDKLENTCIH